MMATEKIKWTAKQIEIFKLLANFSRVLLYGGSSSGKTRAVVEFFVRACLRFPGLRVLFVRHRRQHAKESVWHETLKKEVLSQYDQKIYVTNEQDLYVKFVNDSEIWVSGTDDKERIEKILGRGAGGIYFNEASQISYEAFSTLRTRLRQKIPGWTNRIIADCNPPSPRHWTHRIFLEYREPASGKKLDESMYASLQVNPVDNLENLPDGYIDELKELPEHLWRRFGLGEFVKPAGAVFPDFNESMIIDDEPSCEKYIVGIDLITYAAVLIGLQRYAKKGNIRYKIYCLDEWGRKGAIAHEANEVIRSKWGSYNYDAYIDHNLGIAGTREFDNSHLARKGQGSVEAGIIQIQTAMRTGDFFVNSRCKSLIYELENYHRDENGIIVKEDDHYIDAVRMAVHSAIRKRRIIDGG